MVELEGTDNLVDFGDLPPHINTLLQQGVAAHRSDPARARALFHHAIEIAPATLPAYRCLLKVLNRQREFDAALATAQAGLAEAARQAGLPPSWLLWSRADLGEARGVPQRFVLMFLKAVAFIELRRGHEAACRAALAKLQSLDPEDGVGASVIAALLADCEDQAEDA